VRLPRLATTFVLLTILSRPMLAQADSVRLPPVLRIPLEQEIALAKSAAPAAVSDSAEIWALGDRGFEKVRAGTNGYGCIVQRALSGQSLIPRCDDPSGVAALFPVYQLIETMRRDGKTVGEAKKAIADGFRTGTLKTPKHGGFSYMYSVDGYFAAGDRRIPFTPHAMIYWPNCNTNMLGMKTAKDMSGTALGFIDYGTPECTLIVNTPSTTALHVSGDHKHP
jgi:hypothetical protein